MISAPPLEKAPVFILGCPKSGTTLLAALLDGHPDLLVFPIEIKYFRHTDHPTLFTRMKVCRESRLKEVARRIVYGHFFERMLNRDNPPTSKGESRGHDFSAINPDKFKSYFEDFDDVETHRDLLVHFFKALLISYGGQAEDLSRYHIVEKTPLQEEHAPWLKQWFPNAKFIHLVRNPYATFCSLRKRATLDSSYPYLRPRISKMMLSDYFRRRNESLLSDYMVLTYEDLVTTPEVSVRKVCTFVTIDFHESSLQPTIAGRPWAGNSMFGHGFSGIDSSPLVNWRNEISDLEIAVVNRNMGSVFEAFGYPLLIPNSRLGLYRRQKGEGFLVYIANRILLQESSQKRFGAISRK